MKTIILAAALSLAATAALADKSAANACAANLSGDAKTIYNAVAPQMGPGASVRDLVTQQTRALVQGGTIAQGNARPAAEQAGQCLMLFNS
jgi:hypothetical protein